MSTYEQDIQTQTCWLREEMDLISARVGWLLRQRGIDSRQVWLVKLFPGPHQPSSGIIITPSHNIYQFTYNQAGMADHMAVFDEWLNLTGRYQDHQWRDEILTGLQMMENVHGRQ